ncbi:MAG: hypothetical protein ACTHOH_08945 [Lysobacteraceae bacterium]
MDDARASRAPSTGPAGDGVRIVRHAGPGARRGLLYLALASVLVAGCGGYLLTMHRPSGTDARTPEEDAASAPASAGDAGASDPGTAAAAPSTAQAPTPRRADSGSDPMGDLADYVPPGEVPTMGEVIDRLHAAGVHTGLGAFNPPGTSPPLVGLAVPEDFPLPEGYVRHYQATDDGQRIEPILMFSPDFEFLDANGKPIPIPANRVVPPEYAPRGLPVRRIELPPPREGRGP